MTYQEKRSLWLVLGSIGVILGFFAPCIAVVFGGGESYLSLTANGMDITQHAGSLAVALWLLPLSAVVLLVMAFKAVIDPSHFNRGRLQKIIYVIGCITFFGGIAFFLLDFFTTTHVLATVIRQAVAVRCNPDQDIPCYNNDLPATFGIGDGIWLISLGLIASAYGLYIVKDPDTGK